MTAVLNSPTPIVDLEQRLSADWSVIRTAEQRAVEVKAELARILANHADHDASVVVFGSLARNEFTAGSDVDWTLLVDGLSNPRHMDIAFAIGDELAKLDFKRPGREGVFGGLAFGHDIIHRIGGAEDTNKNTTQRLLLLLESQAIGNDEAYRRVVRNILKRYIIEDYGMVQRNEPDLIPRFLQNDIARFWRTMAVDFAYKRKQRQGSGWALRAVKLRLSRKLSYASGLLACFSCALDEEIQQKYSSANNEDKLHEIVLHLEAFFSRTPLTNMAHVLLAFNELDEAAKELFTSYDEFLGILADPLKREELETLPPIDAAQNPLYQRARELSHRFQGALNSIFLENNGTKLYQLTKTYGVF